MSTQPLQPLAPEVDLIVSFHYTRGLGLFNVDSGGRIVPVDTGMSGVEPFLISVEQLSTLSDLFEIMEDHGTSDEIRALGLDVPRDVMWVKFCLYEHGGWQNIEFSLENRLTEDIWMAVARRVTSMVPQTLNPGIPRIEVYFSTGLGQRRHEPLLALEIEDEGDDEDDDQGSDTSPPPPEICPMDIDRSHDDHGE